MAATTRFILQNSRLWLLVLGVLLAAFFSQLTNESDAQEKEAQTPTSEPKPAPPKKPALLAPIEFDSPVVAQKSPELQYDFPTAAQDSEGNLWIAYVEHNGSEDFLRLAKKSAAESEFRESSTLAGPGIIHQPSITVDLSGEVWAFWGQTSDEGIVHLHASSAGDPGLILAKSIGGSDTFAASGVDSEGRVWVTWQSFRAGQADIFAKVLESDGWSEEIAVATGKAGEWEPRIAFDNEGNAWISYDLSEGNEFNVNLAKVNSSGLVKTWPIAHTPRYEARSDIAARADGSGFWITAERGKPRWGLDSRGHLNNTGINAQKEILFGFFDLETETFVEHDLGNAAKAGDPVNLPTVGEDSKGRPWVAYRYFKRNLWRIAATRFDPNTGTWTTARRVPSSEFGQDRRSQFLSLKNGSTGLCWPSDLRTNKSPRNASVYFTSISPDLALPDAARSGAKKLPGEATFATSQSTPEREPTDRHTWTIGGKTLGLYWGDVHRHTDVSNCRTGYDGCINEHFRYAYDIGKLDFLGTSDHTDVGKFYHPYEWWHNQRMHDVFHAPIGSDDQFNTLYVYEREQRWPWGHRNIVFADRGGPIIYINRATYRKSPWQSQFPVEPGVGEITPTELWGILEDYGKPVTAISHTGATGMGTNWGNYEEPIDFPVETIVEIFQGARVSYEGLGAPQPTAGLRPEERYTVVRGGEGPPPPAPVQDFGKYNAGVYQNALKLGHRLGVFASSDHISKHVSYGGVFCEEFTREGIIEGFQARLTIAATDKIYLNLTCNGSPMGSKIEGSSEKPKLWFEIEGTNTLKRVTIVRNEVDWQVFDTFDSANHELEIVDESPLEGENRYYLRVEQIDGNMAWTSPVWVNPSAS